MAWAMGLFSHLISFGSFYQELGACREPAPSEVASSSAKYFIITNVGLSEMGCGWNVGTQVLFIIILVVSVLLVFLVCLSSADCLLSHLLGLIYYSR